MWRQTFYKHTQQLLSVICIIFGGDDDDALPLLLSGATLYSTAMCFGAGKHRQHIHTFVYTQTSKQREIIIKISE